MAEKLTGDIRTMIANIQFKDDLADIVEKTLTRGGAVVCTNKLTAKQIDEARKKKNLVVSPTGFGFARVPVRWLTANGGRTPSQSNGGAE